MPHGVEKPYWLIVAGGKHDLTTKWWPRAYYQEVVDRLGGRVRFVQVGGEGQVRRIGGRSWGSRAVTGRRSAFPGA